MAAEEAVADKAAGVVVAAAEAGLAQAIVGAGKKRTS